MVQLKRAEGMVGAVTATFNQVPSNILTVLRKYRKQVAKSELRP